LSVKVVDVVAGPLGDRELGDVEPVMRELDDGRVVGADCRGLVLVISRAHRVLTGEVDVELHHAEVIGNELVVVVADALVYVQENLA
jgi:hypothetical protein